MIPIAKPRIGEKEIEAVVRVMRSGQLAQGPVVEDFERAFADWSESAYAVATSSGTSALHLALLAHGIGPGDEVITSSFSFIASANAVVFTGATPVLADIEEEYFTLSPTEVRSQISSRTRALIPVHMYGQMCDMDSLMDIAEEQDLIMIQDACQAHGARFNGNAVSAYGTACYSFYPTKNMTTGEGGMVTTNDPEIADRVRMLRNHGGRQKYIHEILGYNLRMMDLQAAIGLVQLEQIDSWTRQRQANAARLEELLADIEWVRAPQVRSGAEHVFHQYTIRSPIRDLLLEHLIANGVGVGVHYPQPIFQQPVYRELGYNLNHPNCQRACQEVLSLPIHPALEERDLKQIASVVGTLALDAPIQ